MHQSAPHHCRALLPRGHRMAAAGRHQALNAARWHALSVAPRCPVQSLALTHSLSSSRSRVRRGTAMAELAASASPCLWAPSCPSVCATGSAALLLASRAPPRPSFAAVARGHRCRGRRECLCAWPGQPGPPPVKLSGPMRVRRPMGAPPQLIRRRRAPRRPKSLAPARCSCSSQAKKAKDLALE